MFNAVELPCHHDFDVCLSLIADIGLSLSPLSARSEPSKERVVIDDARCLFSYGNWQLLKTALEKAWTVVREG